MTFAFWAARAMSLYVSMICASPAVGQTDCANDIADQQSVTAFSSLIDGQPTDPQRPTLAIAAAIGAGNTFLQTTIQIAPGRSRGLCDAVLSVQLPAIEWNDRVGLSDTIAFGWEQRWHADDGRLPTIATFFLATFDYSRVDPSVLLGTTLILAKTIGRIAVYGNGFVTYKKTRGSVATWTPGFIVGIKAPSTAENAVVLDLVVERGSPASIELAYQFALPGDVDFGPGLAVSLGGNPKLTVGFSLQQEF